MIIITLGIGVLLDHKTYQACIVTSPSAPPFLGHVQSIVFLWWHPLTFPYRSLFFWRHSSVALLCTVELVFIVYLKPLFRIILSFPNVWIFWWDNPFMFHKFDFSEDFLSSLKFDYDLLTLSSLLLCQPNLYQI